MALQGANPGQGAGATVPGTVAVPAGARPASGGGSAAVSGAETPLLFATSILSAMGWPETSSNIDAMIAWEEAEGGNWDNPDAYNPLNTTYGEPNAVSTNSAGVKKYTSWAQGIAATLATLRLNEPGYANIRAAFASGNAASTLPAALSSSAWGTNGSAVASILSNKGYEQYALKTGGSGTGSAGSGSAGSAGNSTGCVFGVGPWCILSQQGLGRFFGALLVTAGGAVILVGVGLLAIGALTDTKAGRTAAKTFGTVGLGGVAAAASAPTRAIAGRRRRKASARSEETERQRRETRRSAQEAHEDAVRRATLRQQRARARRAEEAVRTQRAVTEGRQESSAIREHEAERRTEARRNRATPQEIRANKARSRRREIQQRERYDAVFGE